MRDNIRLGDAIFQYLKYGRLEKNWTKTTQVDYEYYLRDFYGNFGNILVRKITIDQIRDWRAGLAAKRHAYKPNQLISAQTQHCYASAIRYFFDWLNREGYPVLNAKRIEVGNRADTKITVLTPDELYLLLEEPEPFTDFGIRDRAILETFYSTGMRLSELFSLKVTDIDLRTGEIPIIGKGRKRRVVFLSDRAKRALKKWLDIHPASCDSLFTVVRQRNSHTKGPLSRKAIQDMVKRYCRAAGVPIIHCHVLRHTFATQMLRNGIDLYAIKELLGHAKLDSTAIYLTVSNPHLKKEHKRGIRLGDREHVRNIRKRMRHKRAVRVDYVEQASPEMARV